MNLRVALRNLARNRWRTALTIGGVAMATGLVIWTASMMHGWMGMMVQAATGAEVGQVQVVTQGWIDDQTIYDSFPADAALLGKVEAVPAVTGAAPRLIAYGLVGHEKASQVARLVGVDAEREGRVTTVPGAVREGRWLSASPQAPPAAREVVLGAGLADRLAVHVGDELVTFLQAADGSMGNDKLRVVGVMHSGSDAIDRSSAFLHIEDVQWLVALDGRVHELLVRAAKGADLDRVAAGVGAALGDLHGDTEGPAGALVARTWEDAVPELAAMVEASASSMYLIYIIIYLIAALGILNAQRMSALERRREFGVLLAIGLTPGQLGRLIVSETVIISTLGAVLGGALGAAVSLYFAHVGWALGDGASDGSFAYMGVNFTGSLKFIFQWSDVAAQVVLVFFVGLACGLWPALKSARIHAVRAIAGRS